MSRGRISRALCPNPMPFPIRVPPLERSYTRPFGLLGTIHIVQCPCAKPCGPKGGVCGNCEGAILTDEERRLNDE